MVVALAATAFAASYTDTDGHWAEEAIERWTSLDIVKGYDDGEYKPENDLTRGQAAVIFARLLKLEKKADITNFTDVAADAYYADAIAQVVARGIMNGKSSSSMDPEGPLTREEFFTMLVRAIGLPTEEKSEKTFSDENKVSDWAAGSINALVNAGYVQGYENGTIRPENDIKRSEIVALFHQTVVAYANEDGKEVVAPEKGVVIVVADDVTVKSEKGEEVTVVVAKEEGTVTVETAGAVSVVADGATVNVAEENTVYVNADDTTIAATEKAEVVVNAKDATVSLEGTTAEVSVTVAENNVEITDAPNGTSVTVEETVTGTVVNEDKVASDSSYVVGEEPAPAPAPVHTHIYSTELNWYKTTESGVAVYKYGYQCNCGDVKVYTEPADITLTADMTFDAPIYIAAGQKVTLNLAGKNIIAEGHDAIYNYGTLTVKSDGFSAPEFDVDASKNLVFDSTEMKGFIIVENGSADAEKSNCNGIVNWGTLTLDSVGVAVADTYGSALVNSGNGESTVGNSMLLNTGLGNAVYANSGKVTLNDYTIAWGSTYGYAVFAYNNSVVDVNGGFYYSTVGFPFCVCGGTLNLNNDAMTQIVAYNGTSDSDYQNYIESTKTNYTAYANKIEADGATGEIYWVAGTLKVNNPTTTDLVTVVALEVADDLEYDKWTSQIYSSREWKPGETGYYEIDVRTYPEFVKDDLKYMYVTDTTISLGGVELPGTYGELTETTPYVAE